MPTVEGTKVANIDVIGLIDRMDRMYKEMSHCQSNDMANGLFPADLARLNDFLSDFRAFWVYAQTVPIPDAPEAHGVWMRDLPTPDADADWVTPEMIENDDVKKILYHLQVFRLEVANCQSARFIHGFMPVPAGQPSDRQRITDAIERLQNFVNYIAATQPSDRPESTPSFPAVPPGALGTGAR